MTFRHSLNETARVVYIDDASERDRQTFPTFRQQGQHLLSSSIETFPPQFAARNTDSERRTEHLDHFMQIVVDSNSSVPLEAYLEPTTLIAEVRRVYSAFWATYAAQHQRIPLNSEGRQSPELEAIVYSQKQRVVQDRVPTRILQALLGFVLVCGLIMAASMRGDEVLPKAPYSIGSRMSLLAGSYFSQMPELRSDSLTDKELERALEPFLFKLGWSQGVDGTARFGVEVMEDVGASNTWQVWLQSVRYPTETIGLTNSSLKRTKEDYVVDGKRTRTEPVSWLQL